MSEAVRQQAVIRKLKSGKFRLLSSEGKNLGTFDTKKEAEEREKQVGFFRNLRRSSGGRGSLASKVRKRSLVRRVRGRGRRR